MLTGLYAKLIGLGLTLAALAGLFLWGHHVGATSVQTDWDAAKATQAAVADRQAAQNVAQALDWTRQFDTLTTHYEAVTHETTSAVADTVAAATTAGTVRLRDNPDRCPGQVSDAAAHSRAADAAATAALAQRTADAIAAVRVSDAADKREADFRALILALRATLRAERAPAPVHP